MSRKQTNEGIVFGFNALRGQQREIANKVVELESDVTEHKLVLEALESVEKDRKCFRMIGGVLVERTVAEVLPSLQKNRQMIQSLIESLKQQIVQKGQEIQQYMDKHGLHVRSEPTEKSAGGEEASEGPPSAERSILVQKN